MDATIYAIIIANAISAIAILSAIKTDINWIKARLAIIERRVFKDAD